MKKIKLNDIVKVNQSGEWGTGLKEGEIGTKVIRTADFNNDGSINYDNVIFRNIQQKKVDEKKLIYGDIIIEKSGGTDKNPVGRVVFFNDDNNIYLPNNFTQVIRIKESMNSKFVFYNLYFNYKNGSTLQMFNKTTGIQNLQMKQFLNQKISYISLEEQEIAVRKLDNVRNIIEIKQKQLQDLDELIKSQFVEMFGDPKSNDKNWIKAPMGDYMTVLTDFSSNGSYKTLDSKVVMYDEPKYAYMVRTTDLENDDYKNNVKYITEEAYNFLSKSKVYPDDIIMNKIGSAGKVYIMPDVGMPVSLGRNAFLFRYSVDIVPLFIYYLLKSEYGTNEISQCVRGAVTKTITKDDARKVKIIVPPIELQNQFADIVKQIDKQKFEIQKSLEEMQNLQESLMNKYFGG